MDFTAEQQRPRGIKMYTAASVPSVSHLDGWSVEFSHLYFSLSDLNPVPVTQSFVSEVRRPLSTGLGNGNNPE